MKGKDIARFVILVFIILFIALYTSQASGYYPNTESKKTTLTEDAIEKFEQDVKEGKEIVAKNYLQEEKHYNNKASKLGMNISNLIEKGFNKTMNAFFKEIDKAVKSK